MVDLISRLSELRCQYNCFDENERDAYRTLSEAIKALSDVPYTNVGDTISRQAAIDVLEGRLQANGYSNTALVSELNRSIGYLMRLPSAQSEQRWIPVSKRLPNEEEYVQSNGLFIVSDWNRAYAEYFDIYDKKCFGEHTMYGFRADMAVTAWMPLPESYKDGEQTIESDVQPERSKECYLVN